MPKITAYMSIQDEQMMRDASLSPSELIQSGLRQALTGRKEVQINPRYLLFTALTKLDIMTGDGPGLGRRSQRKQAVIDVVNALYPKDTQRSSTVVVITPTDH